MNTQRNLDTMVNLIADALTPDLWDAAKSGAACGDDLSIQLVNAVDDFHASTSPANAAILADTWHNWDARHRLASPDAALDVDDDYAAYQQMVDHDCTHCTNPDCGEPLMYWLQINLKAFERGANGRMLSGEWVDHVNIHCDNPDCPLFEKTTNPADYHQHMATFLAEQSQ